MKRRIFLVIAVLLISIGIFIIVRLVSQIVLPKGKGGLLVTSSVEANVFLNDRPIGKTPLSLIDSDQVIQSGTYDLKISPLKGEQPYLVKIPINPGVLTAVDRTFLTGAFSSASILYFEKINDEDAQLFISSVPDNALITIDGESRGVTPLDIKDIPQSEHEVEIEKNGFAKKTIRIRAVAGYKLVLNTIIGTESDLTDLPQEEITPSPASGGTTPTQAPNVPKVVIIETPTGFLRVRSNPSTSSSEIGRVNPGETYELVDENETWYKIKLASGVEGWISSTYADKQDAGN